MTGAGGGVSTGLLIGVSVGGAVILAILIAACVFAARSRNAKPTSQTTLTATSMAASAVTVDVELPDLDKSVTTVTTQHDLASPPVASDEKI